jgi:hypothetical protein
MSPVRLGFSRTAVCEGCPRVPVSTTSNPAGHVVGENLAEERAHQRRRALEVDREIGLSPWASSFRPVT